MLKKYMVLLMSAVMLMLGTPQVSAAEPIRIYVSVKGKNSNNGTEKAPFLTIARAQKEARTYTAKTMTQDVEIIIGAGVYLQSTALSFTQADSGNNGFRVIYKGENFPVISGGKKVTGFKEENGIWKTYAPAFSVMRELYINGKAAYRASTERELTAEGIYNDPNTDYANDGLILKKDVLGMYQNAEDMSFRWGIGWKHQEMRVEKIIAHPTDAGKVIAMMKQPAFNQAASLKVGEYGVRPEYPFRMENAQELLDSPGEFYFNEKTKELLYVPREGESVTAVEAYAPSLERIVDIKGQSDALVQNLEFSGIRFAHATYLMPERIGSVPGQWSDLQLYESEENRVPRGAVNVEYADGIELKRCMFANMGGVGVSMQKAVTNSGVVGNAFYDLGGSAISVSTPYVAESEVCKQIRIQNNYVTRVSNYYYAFPGIMSYYTQDLTVSNNEVSYVPYSGIGIGWGWSNTMSETFLARTKILNNRIEHYNMECADGGAIYVLSRQKNSEIKGNYVSDSYAPFGAYYFDNGASDFTVANNVSENDQNSIFLWTSSNKNVQVTNTYSNTTGYTNAGTGTTVSTPKTYIKGNPLPEAKRIIDNAGLTAEYRGIKSYVPDNEPYFGRYLYDTNNSSCDALYKLADYHNRYASGVLKIAKTTLSLAETGTLPGQYSAQKKLILQKRVSAYESYKATTGVTPIGCMERLISVRLAQKELEDSLVRYSYVETLQIALELSNGSYTLSDANAQATLKSAIASAKSAQTDEYEKTKLLENAIIAFDKKVVRMDIKGLLVNEYDMETVIDNENKTVTVYAAGDMKVSALTAKIDLSSGSSASSNIKSTFNLTKPIQVTVTNQSVKNTWTVQALPAEDHYNNRENWQNWYGQNPTETDGVLSFEPGDTAFMYRGKKGNKIEMDISADCLNRDGVSLILLAGRTDSQYKSGNYFELKFCRDQMYFYRVENGVKSDASGMGSLSTADFIENIRNVQHISVETALEGRRVNVKVDINGKTAIDTVREVNESRALGYVGVIAPSAHVNVHHLAVTADTEGVLEYTGSNVARGKRAYAGCLSESDKTGADRITDGAVDENSYPWVVAKGTESSNAWVAVDLGVAYNISAILVYSYGASGTVQVSNSSDFSTVQNVGTFINQEKVQLACNVVSGTWRYVRVLLTGEQDLYGLRELEVCSETSQGATNLAKGKTVTVSDSHEWYPGSALVDGRFSSHGVDAGRWTTNYNAVGSPQECYAIIDLKKLYNITSVVGEVFRSAYTATGSAKVYGSRDGVTYDLLTTISTNGKETHAISNNRVFRYVKVSGTDWPGLNWGVWELEVYGDYFGESDGVAYNLSCSYAYKQNNTIYSRIPQSGSFAAEVTYTNTDMRKMLSGMCAEYSADGKLLSLKAVPVVLKEKTENGTVQIPCQVGAETEKFCLFLWDENFRTYAKTKTIKR